MIWLDFETHLTKKKTVFSTYFALLAALLSGTVGSVAFLFFFFLSSQYTDYNPIGPAGSCSEGTGLRAPSAHPPQSRRATHPGRVKNKVGASSAWSARAGHAHSWPELVTLNGRHTSHGLLHPTPLPTSSCWPPRPDRVLIAHTRQQQHPPKCHLSCCPCVPFHRQHRQTDWGRSEEVWHSEV